MSNIIKALLPTTLITLICGLFLSSSVAVLIWQLGGTMPVFFAGESVAFVATMVAASAFFLRAWRYEQYGDARQPHPDQIHP